MIGLITHRIELGDSLQRIAVKYGIDDWTEIAEINKLDPPYINSVFGDDSYKDNRQVAKLGDLILIPSSQAYQVSNIHDNEEIEAEAYGKDLDIYHESILDHEEKGHLQAFNSDIDIVRGLDNLGQQLQSRLSVTKGSLFMHPEFGSELYKYYGKNYTQETINKIIFEIESCIRSDFRVKDLKDLKADLVDGELVIYAQIIPIEPGKPIEFKYIV